MSARGYSASQLGKMAYNVAWFISTHFQRKFGIFTFGAKIGELSLERTPFSLEQDLSFHESFTFLQSLAIDLDR
jgi:hypothetical protein